MHDELTERYGVKRVGACDGVDEHFYAIGTEKKVAHPLVQLPAAAAQALNPAGLCRACNGARGPATMTRPLRAASQPDLQPSCREPQTMTHFLPKLGTLAVLVSLSCASLAAAPTSGLDLAGFDPKVRVQDDLFRAANGNWLGTTEIPADKAEYGTFIQLRDLSDKQVRAIVDELATTRHPAGSVAQKVGAFYSSFMDTAAIDKAGLAPLRATLAEIDAIKTPRQFAQWQGRMQSVLELPVPVWVMADFKEPTLNRAVTWQGGLGLPDRDYYLKKDDERLAKARGAYATYLTTLARLAKLPQPAQAAQRVMAVEQRIAELQWDKVENRNPVKIYNPMTPQALAQLAPGFDWDAFLQAASLGGVDRLSVSQPSTVTGIARLFSELPLAEWKLYFKLHSLDAAAPVLPQAYRDARFAFRGTALTGAKEPKPRWQQAITELNGALGEAVGQLYVERHFPTAYKARMQALVGNLLATYRESIDALSWMTPCHQSTGAEQAGQVHDQDRLPRPMARLQPPGGEAGRRTGQRPALGPL